MYITDENDYKAIERIILDKLYFRNRGAGVETHCSKFEKDFAQKMDSNHALLVTSGTNALICGLLSLGIGPGDEVIIPSYTFFATASAVINVGATPIIANIDETLSIDPKEIIKLITKSTKAIVAVHMDGHPCQMDIIVKIAKENKLFLIEDVAQAIGGKFHNNYLGTFGDVGCFSFNVDKIISAGEGGAVITNERSTYEKSLCIQDGACLFGSTHRDSFKTINPFIGQSMRVSEITGALMNVQLPRLDGILENLRMRKKIIRDNFIKSAIPIINSNDEAGDCATSIYLTFNSIEECREKTLLLNSEKLTVIPVTARPAYACWQWMHLLAEVRPRENYHKSLFLKSIDITMRTVKLDIPFEMELDKVNDLSIQMIKKITT